jgi:MFS family permease
MGPRRARRLVLGTRALRMFAYGLLSVSLGVHLVDAGFSSAEVGLLLTVALAAVWGTAVPLLADGWGYRRVLVVCAGLMAVSGAVLATVPAFGPLLMVAALGLVSPSGQEVGPFQSLEQVVLAEAAERPAEVRPYAWYDFTGLVAGALGSLAVGLLPPLVRAVGVSAGPTASILWAFAASGLALAGLYALLPEETGRRPRVGSVAGGLGRSRNRVLGLTALFGLDALAGGFVVQSLVALWFHQRFGLGPEELGPIFFGTNLLAALSFLGAARLADRFGLLPTMVFTHLPSNILLALVPLAPSWPAAAAALMGRHLLSQMDVPVRRAYIMALVEPEERAAAAGLTNGVRNLAAAVAPMLSGLALQTGAAGLPFLLAGGLKGTYDLLLWAGFRKVPLRNQARAV